MDRLQHIKNRVNKANVNIAGGIEEVWNTRYADDAAWLVAKQEAAQTLLCALADRVYWWSLDHEQDADTVVLAQARAAGWLPWHERPCPEQHCDAPQLGCNFGEEDYRACPRYRGTR